jgi:hypothetical protein
MHDRLRLGSVRSASPAAAQPRAPDLTAALPQIVLQPQTRAARPGTHCRGKGTGSHGQQATALPPQPAAAAAYCAGLARSSLNSLGLAQQPLGSTRGQQPVQGWGRRAAPAARASRLASSAAGALAGARQPRHRYYSRRCCRARGPSGPPSSTRPADAGARKRMYRGEGQVQ